MYISRLYPIYLRSICLCLVISAAMHLMYNTMCTILHMYAVKIKLNEEHTGPLYDGGRVHTQSVLHTM